MTSGRSARTGSSRSSGATEPAALAPDGRPATVSASPRPGVTVVIPFWDLDPQILLDAVSSVAEQGATYRTIVVDNASTVPLPELPGYAEVLRLPERGNVGDARNAGLALVETSHVLFLDADDILFPGSIPFLLEQLGRRPDVVASCGGGVAWRPGPGGGETVPWRRGRFHLLNTLRLQRLPRLLALVNTVKMILSMSCTLLRTDAVRAAGGFSSDVAEEDWVLSAALAFHGPIVAGTKVVRRYRLRPDGLNTQKAADWRISSAARRELRRRLRHDPAVPLAVRLATPLLAVLHARPALRRLAALVRSSPRRATSLD